VAINGTQMQIPPPPSWSGPYTSNSCCDLCLRNSGCTGTTWSLPWSCTFYSQVKFLQKTGPGTISFVMPNPPTDQTDWSRFNMLVALIALSVVALGFIIVYIVQWARRKRRKIGKYEVLRELGHGSFSTVYLVHRLTDGALLALKLIPCRSHEQQRDCEREYKALAHVRGHPHVLHVLEVLSNAEGNDFREIVLGIGPLSSMSARQGVSVNDEEEPSSPSHVDHYVGIITAYYPEGSLQRYLTENAPSQATILAWGRQIASALTFMHSRGVIHRDLKPGNLLMSDNGKTCLVADLGLSRITEEQYVYTKVGTLQYMAPEQADRRYSSQADLWALGCILYVCFSRRLQIPDVRTMFIFRQQPDFEEKYKDDMRKGGATEEVISFVLLLLDTDPHKRPTALAAFEVLSKMVGTEGEVVGERETEE